MQQHTNTHVLSRIEYSVRCIYVSEGEGDWEYIYIFVQLCTIQYRNTIEVYFIYVVCTLNRARIKEIFDEYIEWMLPFGTLIVFEN